MQARHVRRALTAGLLIALLLAPGFSAGVGNTAPFVAWRTETVSVAEFGIETTLALGDNGQAFVFYTDRGGPRLATKTLTGWDVEVIGDSSSANSGGFARDSKGVFHASLRDWDTAALKYATNASGKWTVSVVDPNPVRYDHVLVVDHEDRPHIAYPQGGICHAQMDSSGVWHTELVEAHSTGLWPMRLAVDSKGEPHIAYGVQDTPTTVALFYASRIDGTWQIQRVSDHCGSHIGMAIWQDKPQITCWDHGLRWYSWNGTAWQTELADNNGGGIIRYPSNAVGLYTDLAIDSKGNPHVAYWVLYNIGWPNDPLFPGQLHYATRQDGQWIVETVDRWGQNNGDDASIKLDKHDRPHFAYVHVWTFFGPYPDAIDRGFDPMYAAPLTASAVGPAGL